MAKHTPIDTRSEYLVAANNGKHFIWAYDEDHASRIATTARHAKEVIKVELWSEARLRYQA